MLRWLAILPALLFVGSAWAQTPTPLPVEVAWGVVQLAGSGAQATPTATATPTSTPTATPSATPTATPTAPTVAYVMYYDDGSCEDAGTTDSCAAGLITGASETDCASGKSACPIGTSPYSYLSTCEDIHDTGTPQTTGFGDDLCDYDGSTAVTEDSYSDCAADGSCVDLAVATIDFVYAHALDKNYAAGSTIEIVIVKKSTSGNHSWFWVIETNNRMDFQCNDTGTGFWNITLPCEDFWSAGGPPQTTGTRDGLCDSDGSTSQASTVVAYNIRVEIDTTTATDECHVYVDTAASGNWGVGAIKDSGVIVSGTDSGAGVGGLSAYNEAGDQMFIVDDVGICDTSGGLLEADQKCED